MDRAQVFVRVDEYNAIQDVIKQINERLDKAKSLLDHLNELKQQEDQHILAWSRDLGDVSERCASVDQAFLEPQE